MIAFLEAYRAGLLRPVHWLNNLIAGLIVGVVALPLSMAFAIASGVKPEQGLYTAIVAGLIVGIFGGSRVQIAGPTGAFIVILAGITAHYGVEGLQIATLMAGVLLLLMGLLKFGSVIKFIPDPVIIGFTAGIGVIIFVGEWKDFFGLSVHIPLDAHFHQKILLLLAALPHFDFATTALGLLSLLLVLAAPRIIKQVPGPLAAMVVVTSVQLIFHFKTVATLGSAFGGIPQQLPYFHFPDFGVHRSLFHLVEPAITIALLGAIESLLSATAADGMAQTRHHSNQELVGQGLANIIAPLFGGFAATGAIARTATNIRNGGNSPLAAIVHSVVLLLVILLFAPLAAGIPLCCLAAILFVVAYNMSDLPHFSHMLRKSPKPDVWVLLITFLLTVFTDLVIAVNIGVLVAMLFFVRRMHQATTVSAQSAEQLRSEFTEDSTYTWPKDVLVYTLQGPLFFGAAEKIERTLYTIHADPRVIVLRFKNVPFIDTTGLETLREIMERYHQRGILIFLCEATPGVQHKMVTFGLLEKVVEHRNFAALSEIIPFL